MAISSKYGEVTLEFDSVLSESEEPVFVIRAQDALALQVIRDYRFSYTDSYGNETSAFVEAVEITYDLFEQWQEANDKKVKKPD